MFLQNRIFINSFVLFINGEFLYKVRQNYRTKLHDMIAHTLMSLLKTFDSKQKTQKA